MCHAGVTEAMPLRLGNANAAGLVRAISMFAKCWFGIFFANPGRMEGGVDGEGMEGWMEVGVWRWMDGWTEQWMDE